MSRGRHVRERTSAVHPIEARADMVVDAPDADALAEADAPADAAADAESAPEVAAEISVRGGNPTPAEGAAVVAVVAAAVDEVRIEGEFVSVSAPSAWERSQRGLRGPLAPGSWRSFTGGR